MKTILALALLLVAFAAPALAQPPFRPRDPDRYRPRPPIRVERDRDDFRREVPDLNGVWYMNGNRRAPCEITQDWPSRRAQFVNEHGSSAWGTIRGDRVLIPDWSDGTSDGLEGRIRGNRIVWPDGNYWSR
jgi:hypothetical protein